MLQDGWERREEDECLRYDEIRDEGVGGGGGEGGGAGGGAGGGGGRDELLMAQQVWPPLGNTGA